MTSERVFPAWVGYVFALIATVVWSGNFVVARGVTNEIPPVQLAFLRWLVAFVVVLPFAVPSLKKQWLLIRERAGYFFMLSLTGVTVFNTFIYIAGQHTTALNLSIIATFTPVFILLLSHFVLGEKCGMRQWGGLVLAVAGVITLVTGGDFSRLFSLSFNIGDVWMLMATMIFAVYSILIRKRPMGVDDQAFLGATFGLGLFMLAPWAFLEWQGNPVGALDGRLFGIIGYIGIGASLVSYYCWNRAIKIVGPANTSIVYYSLPLFSGIEAALLLGESVGWQHFVSGACITAGILFATRK